MRRWIPVFAGAWIFLLLFVAYNLLNNNADDKTEEILAQLSQCKRKYASNSFDHLHTQIRLLKQELEETKKKLGEPRGEGSCPPCRAPACAPQKSSESNEAQGAGAGDSTAPWSLTTNLRKRDKVRRRVLNTMREMWFYIRRQLGAVKDTAGGEIKSRLSDILDDLIGYYQSAATDIVSLGEIGGMKEWRQGQADLATSMIAKRIQGLQEPDDCTKSKRLVCDLGKGCGFGCQIHHVFYCMATAFGTGRTFIVQGQSWSYSRSGWNGVFKPTSAKCESHGTGHSMWRGDDDETDVIKMPIIDGVSPRPKALPLAVPSEFVEVIEGFHTYPSVYWFGHLARYIMRYAPAVKESIDKRLEEIGFKHPIVGIHVRRTDKINTEAAFHHVKEYMLHVEEWYLELERTTKVDKRRVYLASDDPKAIDEARSEFPAYEFLNDKSSSLNAGVGSRYSDAGLKGVVFDIEVLSRTDFLSCTFSSQVCRVAYELMQPLHIDAGDKFRSLDDIYYFGGQRGHDQRAIYPHKGRNGQLDIEVGDLFGIAGNHWDGYSKGTNRRTGRLGMYPAYKVEEVQQTYDAVRR
ncbi:alpha-(1,6)-fucosyltransferase-like [Sycon ciliatum]|uniref:alpha-(1,6)-fucosyltransferase-like n=1 Tax=Sycon ciliatum TaxID=27933 RepID=UPI0031F65795